MRAAAVFAQSNGQEVVLTREAGANGRLRSAINGAPSSAEALRALASDLIVIHGQHDSLLLRNRAEVLRVIDEAGAISSKELDAVRKSLREARSLLDSSGGDVARRQREVEFLAFQISDIEAVQISSSSELADILDTLTRLTALRDGQMALDEVLNDLDADGEDAVLSRMATAIEKLPDVASYNDAREALRGALTQAREAVRELASLADPDSFEPGVVKELDERAATLQHLARKYGGSLESALRSLDEFRADLARHKSDAMRLSSLDQEISELIVREAALAGQIRRERELAAQRLGDSICQQLPRVALPNATLRFEVDGDDGADALILFSANPGLPEGPLSSLASGGELSRVLLALSLESSREDVVAVFDEIDAGLGGQVAQQIGQCLFELGSRQQVLAVTHLASVAARADHHFVVEKTTSAGLTSTVVRNVVGEQRVQEIARMLAGDDVSDEARALAAQLLETSR
jgi:DNA repair protein RecN (Recombination protein N)